MDEQTRYRVTGSLFLLALAIICLPMLFDGEGVASIELEPLAEAEPPSKMPRLDDVRPQSDYVERVEALRASIDEDGYLADSGTRIGEPVLTAPGPDSAAWAVQIAAFAVAENARNLHEELKRAGYEAFISNHKTPAGIRSRVAVGPLLNLEAAKRLRNELASRFDEDDARVVAFSN